jgi:hypothetical protein
MLGNMMQMEAAVSKLDDAQLAQYLRDPNSPIPAFLVLAELKKRKDMRAGAKPEPRTVREAVAGFSRGGIVPEEPQVHNRAFDWAIHGGGDPEGALPEELQERNRPWSWRALYDSLFGQYRQRQGGATGSWEPAAQAKPDLTQQPDLTRLPDFSFAASGRASGGVGNVSAPAIAVPGQLTDAELDAMLPAAPQFEAPSLDKSIARGKEIEQQLGFDFSKAQKALEDRRKKLEERRADDKNMALLRAGLGIMSGTSPYAAANIGRGAMAGLDYLAKAQEAQRLEEQAIADNDLALARQAHTDKLQFLQLAAGEQAGQVNAANQTAQAKYTRGITGLGVRQQRERDIGEAQRFNAEAKLRAAIANQSAQAAALRASYGGIGDSMQFDTSMVRPVFEKLMERDALRLQELQGKARKSQLTADEHAEMEALRSPNRTSMLLEQSYRTVMGAGGLRDKRTQQPAGNNIIDMTTR